MHTPGATTPVEPGIPAGLPHRPPFLFISEVIERSAAGGVALWRVTGEEPYFAGHFPGAPLVPGTLLTEALAQVSGIVAFAPDSSAPGAFAKLVHVDVRFKESVVPPAEIRLESRAGDVVGNLHQFEVVARCGGRVVARGRLVLAQTPPGATAR